MADHGPGDEVLAPWMNDGFPYPGVVVKVALLCVIAGLCACRGSGQQPATQEPGAPAQPGVAAPAQPVQPVQEDRCDPLPGEGSECGPDDGYCVIDWGEPCGYSRALWCRDGKWVIEEEVNLCDDEPI